MRVVLAALSVLLLGGCHSQEPQRATDCSQMIRVGDVVYREAGFVAGPARPAGRAERASCDDNGEDARGAYFPPDARQVHVWSFGSQGPRTVLGVRESGDRFRVFVAEGENAGKVMRAVKRSMTDRQ